MAFKFDCETSYADAVLDRINQLLYERSELETGVLNKDYVLRIYLGQLEQKALKRWVDSRYSCSAVVQAHDIKDGKQDWCIFGQPCYIDSRIESRIQIRKELI